VVSWSVRFSKQKKESEVVFMKIRQILLAGVAVMLLATGNAWAATTQQITPITIRTIPRAPEIDAASGTSAIALLTGVLLLVGERSRSRRS